MGQVPNRVMCDEDGWVTPAQAAWRQPLKGENPERQRDSRSWRAKHDPPYRRGGNAGERLSFLECGKAAGAQPGLPTGLGKSDRPG